MDWLSMVIEEYRSLRVESMQAIDRQQRILAIGVTSSGVILGIGAEARPGSALFVALLIVLAPLLASLVMLLWLGEMERMVRAGAHLAVIEGKVAAHYVEEPPLEWESLLRREPAGRRRVATTYRAIFAILLALAASALGIGILGIADRACWAYVAVASAWGLAILCWATRFYVCTEYRLRAVGGRVWTRDDLPWQVRVLGCASTVLGAVSPSTARADAARALATVPPPLLTVARRAAGGAADPHGDVEACDCVIAFAFGARRSGPGESNVALARVVAGFSDRLPCIVQREIGEALGSAAGAALHVLSPPGRYADTRAVARSALAVMRREGWRTALVVAHPHHVGRAEAVCRRLGIATAVPPGLDAVPFDPRSSQPWTRNRALWLAREAPTVLLYRLRRWS